MIHGVPLDCDGEGPPPADCRAVNRQVLANLRRLIADVKVYEDRLRAHTHRALFGAIADISMLVADTDALIACMCPVLNVRFSMR